MDKSVNIFELKDKDIVSYHVLKASWLQKCVRRGLINKAISIGNLYLDDNQEKGLIRKLMVFCAEDIGLGYPQSIIELEKIQDSLKKIEFLCKLPKNREPDKFLWAVNHNYDKLLINPETKKEAMILKILIKASNLWKEDKRNKENKTKLVELFVLLEKNCEKKHNKELINKIKDNYFDLVKNNSFGVDNFLAMAVLISTRDKELPESIIIDDDSLIKIPIDIVDDFALDKHTFFGKALNRGFDHWVKEGSLVIPEVFYSELYSSDGSLKYDYILKK